MSDAEYRLLIQRSFDEELSKQEHRAFVNHLETSDSGQKFHHQLDQMIQAAQDTPLPDDLRPQNPEALARMIMEQLPQKKGSIFAMFTNLFGGGGGGKAKPGASKNGQSKGSVKVKGGDKKADANRGAKKGKGNVQVDVDDENDVSAPTDRRLPGMKLSRKEKAAEAAAEELENSIGTFSRLGKINSRANDAMENRDAQSTTRSLGEKFGMPGATSNPLDEAPLTLAESIKRKVSESQKLSPLDMESEEYSQETSGAQAQSGGNFARPQDYAAPEQGASAWSAPTPIGLPIKQKMGAPVTAQGLDWSGAPAGSGTGSYEEHPGSAIGLAPPGQKPPTQQNMGAVSSAASGGGLDWGGAPAAAQNNQSGWGSNQPAMEPTSSQPQAFAPPTGMNNAGISISAPAPVAPAAPATADGGGWGSGWGNENQAPAPGAPVQGTGVPLKSSDSWAVPGSEAASSWGQPGETPAAAFQPEPVAASPGVDPWGSAAVANSGSESSTSTGGWSSLSNGNASAPAPMSPAQGEGDGGNWGQAGTWGAPGTQADSSSTGTLDSVHNAAPAPANDPWAQPAQPAAAAPTASTNDAWASVAAEVAKPAAVAATNDPWAQPAPAAAVANDPWAQPASMGAPPAFPAPVATNDPWAQPVSEPAPAPSNDPWGQASQAPQSAQNFGAPASTIPASAPAPVNDPWAQAAAAPQALAPVANENVGWSAPAAPAADASGMAWGQSASGGGAQPIAPAPLATPAWGSPESAPPDASAMQPVARAAWSPEAEQMETGTWQAYGKKEQSTPLAPAASAFVPQSAPAAAPAGDRWDQPIQDRKPEPAATEAARWDVPIQARTTGADLPAPAPIAPVMSSGIPVNQIVEKMGAVLGGGQDNRWDVPIQERANKDAAPEQAAEVMPAAPANAAPFGGAPAPAAPSAWGDTPSPSPSPAPTTWGTHPEQPTTTPWGAVESAPAAAPAGAADAPAAPAAWSAPAEVAPQTQPAGWGNEKPQVPSWTAAAEAAPAAAPAWNSAPAAAAPAPSGWGVEPPAAAPTLPAPSAWAAEPPAAPAAPAGAEAWGQPPAWGQASPTPAPAAPPAPEVTDRNNAGGMFNLADRDIDKIFGDNLGVSEPVGRTLVNTGGTDPSLAVPAAAVNNFAPPQAPAAAVPQTQAPAPIAQVQAPAAAPQATPAAQENKGLFSLTDNDLDKLFSNNLGVDEPSTQVANNAPSISPVQAANNFAPPAQAAPAGWSAPAEAPAAQPAGWGVPAPAPVAGATTSGGGWSAAPQAPSGWGMEAAQPAAAAPSGWSGATPAAPAAEAPGGWGTPTPPAPPAWNQAPAAAAAPAQEQKGGLFSVDDNVMNRIFSDNLGIPEDANSSSATNSSLDSQTDMGMSAPPKIAGIGRLDASADQNQDAGSGRIASIGKFLLDQKDLDKIGKLTSSDFNEGKMRILTLEASQDLQSLLSQIGTQQGVVGSVIVGHDGLLIANTMPGDMDAESVGVWALGVYMNTEHVTKKMGHDRVHQVVSRTHRGYVVIADFGGGLLVTVTDGRDTDSLIPLMRTITQLVN